MDVVANLIEALDLFARADPFSCADAQSVVALQRGRASYDSSLSAVVATFAEGGEWASEGARSAAAWLSTMCHLPMAEAKAQVRRGAALASMPLVAQAFSAGEIGSAHVDRLVKAQGAAAKAAQRSEGVEGAGMVDPQIFARCEPDLVRVGKELTFGAFCDVVTYFSQMADPVGADESDMAKATRRDVSLSESIHGMYFGAMTLDPFSGAIVSSEHSRLEAELFEADWAQAKASLGREPRVDELSRTPAQRRADALVEMAVRSRAAKEGDRRPEPLFTILVGYESLYGRICRIEGGPIVSPGSLLPWLEGATFERIVFSPGTRIECSPKARFFTGATRRAIEVRDQICSHDFCEVTSQKGQIDHIVAYSQGGETTQENGRVLCGFHNRLRNQGKRGEGGGDGNDGDGGGGAEAEAEGEGEYQPNDDLYDEGGP